MKQKIKKVLINVNDKILETKDKLFQTNEQEIHNGLFSVIKKNLFSIPVSIRVVSFSLFLFMLGWGLGADTYFSVYLKSIVDDVLFLSIIGALLPFSKMILSLSIGELNDRGNMKILLFMSKIFYIIAGFLFLFAGIFHQPIILIIAVVLNGFAGATMFTTYESYIRLESKKHSPGNSRGLYFSSINAAYLIGAILSAVIINRIELPYVYIFVIIFGILSLFTDKKIVIHQKRHLKEVFSKESFLHQFIKEVFSFAPLKRAYIAVKGYSKSMIYTLGFEALFNIMAYIGFLFIPLVAIKNNLSLSEIALVFGLMRLPYVTNFFTNGWFDRYDKKLFIIIVILFLSFLFASFGFNESFGSILIISFGISLGLSMIRPVISSLISEQTHINDTGTITGVQQFVAMLACIFGSIGFGFFSEIFGMQTTFILVGLSLFVLAIWGIGKKMKYRINTLKTKKIINSM
ncbi:Membrane protein [candidate division SR1 bacterium RAAC1_SR1_1]|nr:Membrane protein [candidate division SR1 bacterium RAAC1_SR1_1]